MPQGQGAGLAGLHRPLNLLPTVAMSEELLAPLPPVTEDEYKQSIKDEKAAQLVQRRWFHQNRIAYEARLAEFRNGRFFTKDELCYSSDAKCSCGYGVAYPKMTNNMHDKWTCAAVLLGRHAPNTQHDAFPFAFYEIKSEDQPSAYGRTTRNSEPYNPTEQ